MFEEWKEISRVVSYRYDKLNGLVIIRFGSYVIEADNATEISHMMEIALTDLIKIYEDLKNDKNK